MSLLATIAKGALGLLEFIAMDLSLLNQRKQNQLFCHHLRQRQMVLSFVLVAPDKFWCRFNCTRQKEEHKHIRIQLTSTFPACESIANQYLHALSPLSSKFFTNKFCGAQHRLLSCPWWRFEEECRSLRYTASFFRYNDHCTAHFYEQQRRWLDPCRAVSLNHSTLAADLEAVFLSAVALL